ncbi:unnamed protein product [Porites evermanni]|uniref:Uncharacterized protein n=1 Tax=Porites evermanni TaxID=104178 RepID=A0ABN8MNI7_9CNID|nr:unnamed protein product [Porites evermanni]
MGSGASANRRGSVVISPRAEAITKLKENGQLMLDSPALIDLGHGTVRYRHPDEKREKDNTKVKTGYFYHPRLDDFSEDAEVRPDDSFKFHYVFKGPKKDGKVKRLYYVYGTHLSAKDEGIKQEPYRPVGKGYNWPESYRKANNLYYELTFPEQGEGEEDFTDSDSVITGADSPELADSVPDKDNMRIVLEEMETVDSLKMRMSLRLLIPSVNFHILYNKKELRPEDIVGDRRTPEQGNWRKFPVLLHLT